MPLLPSTGDVLESVTVTPGTTDDGVKVWAQFFLVPIPGPLYDQIVSNHVREGMTFAELEAAAAPDLIAASLVGVASSEAPERMDLDDGDAQAAALEFWLCWPNQCRADVINAVKKLSGVGDVVRPFALTTRNTDAG